MYKVNICSAIVILETNMTVLTRTGSIYNEFFFSQVYHAAPFLEVRMEAALFV